MVNRISAEIIADSINEFGNRLTTYVLVFPRIVLAEFNTHRMISKNSASSRAIPFKTMLQKVKDEPFVPIAWQKEHKGMQGTEYFKEIDRANILYGEPDCDETATWGAIEMLEECWLEGRNSAIDAAEGLNDMGVTKQLCNRLLEPYLYHTVICTGSEWENFFALRAHPDAEIHIADLAEKMLVAYNDSTPKPLKAGEWHIPFGDTFDLTRLNKMVGDVVCSREEFHKQCQEALADLKVKIATARCARISYLNFEGKDDYSNDIRLYDQLLKSGHMSPFEHCAQAMGDEEYCNHVNGYYYSDDGDFSEDAHGWSGNFKGFIQHRKMIQGENKTDERIKK